MFELKTITVEINGFLVLSMVVCWAIGFFISIYIAKWIIPPFKKYVETILIELLKKNYTEKNTLISWQDRQRALEEINSVKADISIKEPPNKKWIFKVIDPIGVDPIGFFERMFFTLLAASYPSSALAPMVIWLGVKIVQNWQASKPEKSIVSAAFAFCSLSFSVLSITFAFVGGLICNAWRLHFY